jgi:hypothetical protein
VIDQHWKHATVAGPLRRRVHTQGVIPCFSPKHKKMLNLGNEKSTHLLRLLFRNHILIRCDQINQFSIGGWKLARFSSFAHVAICNSSSAAEQTKASAPKSRLSSTLQKVETLPPTTYSLFGTNDVNIFCLQVDSGPILPYCKYWNRNIFRFLIAKKRDKSCLLSNQGSSTSPT